MSLVICDMSSDLVVIWELSFEIPPPEFNFDLSSNAAMILAKSNKENPRSIAEKIKEILLKEVNDFSEINVAGPGFLNISFNFSYSEFRSWDIS